MTISIPLIFIKYWTFCIKHRKALMLTSSKEHSIFPSRKIEYGYMTSFSLSGVSAWSGLGVLLVCPSFLMVALWGVKWKPEMFSRVIPSCSPELQPLASLHYKTTESLLFTELLPACIADKCLQNTIPQSLGSFALFLGTCVLDKAEYQYFLSISVWLWNVPATPFCLASIYLNLNR